MVSDLAFESLNPLANVYIYYRKDSNSAGKQLVAWNAGYLRRYEPVVDHVTGLIFSTAQNAQKMLSGIPAMAMACVMPTAINYAMILNPYDTNAVKAAHIYSWQYAEIASPQKLRPSTYLNFSGK